LKTKMRALSVRQPWAELILRGHKTIEVRSKRTNLRERVFIYAGLNRIEQAEEARMAAQFGIDVDGLPRGVLVGTVGIVGCLPLSQDDNQAACIDITDPHGFYAWLLAWHERAENLLKPKNQPQPMFFNPF
jgi:ASCH domain-containing protein